MARTTHTPEERASKVEALSEELNAAVESLTSSTAWRSMMATAAKFNRYSFRNQVILWVQAADRGVEISRVASFGTWRKLGYSVVKGSKAFRIFAPVKTRLRPEEIAKWLAEGHNPYGPDERPKMVLRGFKVESVFDVSQTVPGPDATPLDDPNLWVSQTGNGPEGLWSIMSAMTEAAGFRLDVRPATPEDGGAHGWTNYTDRVVWVNSECDEAERLRILAHEYAGHVRAGHSERAISRAQRETEADSIAYLVLRILGMDISSSSISYIANWSDGDTGILMSAGETVRSVAMEILSDIEDR